MMPWLVWMVTSRRGASTAAARENAGRIASSSGKARQTPAPRRKLRRDRAAGCGTKFMRSGKRNFANESHELKRMKPSAIRSNSRYSLAKKVWLSATEKCGVEDELPHERPQPKMTTGTLLQY